MSLAAKGLILASTYEAELLTELMLRYWQHPLADDKEFRNGLVEDATTHLKRVVNGEKLFDDVPAESTSFVAAVVYAEWAYLENGGDDPGGMRRRWIDNVRRTITSCFCHPDDLSEV